MHWISSHTRSHTCRHIHTPSEIGTYDLKKLYKARKLSIHSISVTEVLERPFSSDRTLSRDTLLPSLESNQCSSDLAFTFFPPHLLCSKGENTENEGWYHRRRPWKCQAQGIWSTLIQRGAEQPHITHPEYLEVCRQVVRPTTGLIFL